jgi:hypothetical protein
MVAPREAPIDLVTERNDACSEAARQLHRQVVDRAERDRAKNRDRE